MRAVEVWFVRLGALLAVVGGGCSGGAETTAVEPVSDHRSLIESWREERDQSLRKPDGWLTLAGLYWLEEGDNAFGSGEGNAAVFPDGLIDEYTGVLVRDGREVELLPGAGVALTIGGSPVSGATALSLDTSEGGPTIVESGSVAFYAIERGEMIGVRLKDRESRLLTEFEGMEYFPIDEDWRLVGRYELFDEPRVLRTPNILGTVSGEEIFGEVVLEVGGERHSLQPSGDPEDGFFLVFGDQTNGSQTYGGGRFVYAEPVGDDGTVVVDFNKAYCPPCVFTPYATCPLPPPENRLPFRVEAGEKMFGAAH
ncbi:MAG: DUF1684 domain-containing protein [bacterium]|nr:DUF1684 domain-containing protein [bacterium]